MIILTNADDNQPFRIGAHAIHAYYQSKHCDHRVVTTSIGTYHVTETLEFLDSQFYVPKNWTAQPVDEYSTEEEDGNTLHT
jgi:hypothetical protein